LAWAVIDLVIAGGRGLGLTLPERHEIAAIVAARSVPQTAAAIAYPTRAEELTPSELFQQIRYAIRAGRHRPQRALRLVVGRSGGRAGH
jgi:hypothetical protein